MSYQNEKDITVQLSKFLQITGIISRTLNLLMSKNRLDWKQITLWHNLLHYMDAKRGQI